MQRVMIFKSGEFERWKWPQSNIAGSSLSQQEDWGSSWKEIDTDTDLQALEGKVSKQATTKILIAI